MMTKFQPLIYFEDYDTYPYYKEGGCKINFTAALFGINHAETFLKACFKWQVFNYTDLL